MTFQEHTSFRARTESAYGPEEGKGGSGRYGANINESLTEAQDN